MKLIALETSAKTASAAVVTEGKLLGVSSVTAGLTHSQTILPLLETLLKVGRDLNDHITMGRLGWKGPPR